jgi:hypothetical protein
VAAGRAARGNAQKDDWAWTLALGRQPPACCAGWKTDRWWLSPTAPERRPRLKARLMATGQEGTFGESGERFSAIRGRDAVQQP